MYDLWQRLRPVDADKHLWIEIFAEIQRRYREPHRAYHNLLHIEEMTSLLIMHEQRLLDPFSVMMAAFFHDIVLVSGARDNEKKSAALATELLTPFKSNIALERIADLIRATERHTPYSSDCDLCFLIDADLAILGSTASRFQEYELGIRQEYIHLPTILYNIGIRKFLVQMIRRPSIFMNSEIKTHLEERARENLTNALSKDT